MSSVVVPSKAGNREDLLVVSVVEDTQSLCQTNPDLVHLLGDPASEAAFKVASKAEEGATSEVEVAFNAMEVALVVGAVSAIKAVAASAVGKASMAVLLLLTHRVVLAVVVVSAVNRMGTMTVEEVGMVVVEVEVEVEAMAVVNVVA